MEKKQGDRTAKRVLLIEEAAAGLLSMQQPKEKGKQLKVFSTHPQEPSA